MATSFQKERQRGLILMLSFLSILRLIEIIHFLEVSKAHFYFPSAILTRILIKRGEQLL